MQTSASGFEGASGNLETQDLMSSTSLTTVNGIEEYVAEFKEINMDEIRKSPLFKKRRYIDALYFGEQEEGKRNG
jgi:hypothetical protein